MNQSNSLKDLLNQAGQKAGIDPRVLKEKADSGKLDEIVANMRPQDAANFQRIMSNPALAQQMLNTPQAQALIRKFMQN